MHDIPVRGLLLNGDDHTVETLRRATRPLDDSVAISWLERPG